MRRKNELKIAVIGTGYVGLVTGVCLAKFGHKVICVDKDQDKIINLKWGEVPIFEPGLEQMISQNDICKRLSFTTNLDEAIQKSDVCFICVDTPSDAEGNCDLTNIMTVAKQIGQSMNGYKLVINKSTAPVGTVAKIKRTIKKHSNHVFDVVSNPEFLKEGEAIDDFMHPDRIIVGADRKRVFKIIDKIYYSFIKRKIPIIKMDVKSAELTKYAANAMLATRISFINDMAILCEKIGADIEKVSEGIGLDRRIGPKFLSPGPGYGGSCFSKDLQAIINTSHQHKHSLRILQAVEDINHDQKNILYNKIKKFFNNNMAGKHIGIWGLSYKANTDDIRGSAAINLIENLLSDNVQISVNDPQAMDNTKKIFGKKITYYRHKYNVVDEADALVIVTNWDQYLCPKFGKMKRLLNQPVIFDGRNLYPPDQMKKMGFSYFSIGRG